jgi:hypothetical protein
MSSVQIFRDDGNKSKFAFMKKLRASNASVQCSEPSND